MKKLNDAITNKLKLFPNKKKITILISNFHDYRFNEIEYTVRESIFEEYEKIVIGEDEDLKKKFL